INDVPLDTWRDQQRYSRFAPLVDVRVEIDQRRWDEEWVGFAFGPGEEASVNNIDRQQLDAEYYTDVEFRVLALWDIGEILFDPVEPAIETAGAQLYKERGRLALRVVKVMMQRRALQVR